MSYKSMWKRAGLLLGCLATAACSEKGPGELGNNVGDFQARDAVWQRATLAQATPSYQLDRRGVLRSSVELPAGMDGEWFPLSHALPDGTPLDALRTGETLHFVADSALQAQPETWSPSSPAPTSVSTCPFYRMVTGRLQQAEWGAVRPLGTSGGYMTGVDAGGGLVALSDVCVNALRVWPRSQDGPYIYAGMGGETAIAKEFINEHGPQPVRFTTQMDATWPICLKRLVMFMKMNWQMYSLGGIVDDSGHVIRPSTLVCAEADDPRLFIAPDRIYPRHTTAYDAVDHRVLQPEALANMWNQWEVLIETFTSWRNLGSYWVKIEGERNRLLNQEAISFGWNAPGFPAGISQDSDDHAWLHPAGYPMPGGSLTNGNGRLQFSFKTWTPPNVMHLTLTATTNKHPNTGDPPIFPGYPMGPEPFVYNDYPSYVTSQVPHKGYVSVPLDMTVIEWPE